MATNHSTILKSYLWIICNAGVLHVCDVIGRNHLRDGSAFYVRQVITYDNARRLVPATPDHQVLTGEDGRKICLIAVRSIAEARGNHCEGAENDTIREAVCVCLFCGPLYDQDM